MAGNGTRPRVGVVKLTSCDGCQLAILDLEDELLAIAERFELADFPEATSNRWSGPFDVLFVEGQGSIVHPAYSGVTMGLIHGSAPHLYVLCHLAGTTEIEGYPGHPLPSLPALVELHERLSLPARPATVACVAVNTRFLGEADAHAAIEAAAAETGLPADDPVRFGPEKLLEAVVQSRL